MNYKIFKEIRELPTFEEAMILGGLPRQPEFSEAHGDLFFHAPSGIVILAIPEPGDDDLTAAVTDFVGLFDGRLVLDDEPEDDEEDTNAGANLFLKELAQ
jgi:hypothetical protein